MPPHAGRFNKKEKTIMIIDRILDRRDGTDEVAD